MKSDNNKNMAYLPDAQAIINLDQIAVVQLATEEASGGRVIVGGARTAVPLTTGDRAVLMAHIQERIGNPLAIPEA